MPPAARGRVVILTSGTTGTPKGANRRQPASLDPAAALLASIPLRARERTLIAAPMFHSWGFAHLVLGIALARRSSCAAASTPRATLQAIDEHGATALVVVPVMLQRMLELGDEGDRPPRPRRAARHRRQRLGAARRARDARHGRLRRRALQPLRLDRGRVGDGRHAAGPARGARHGRAPAARHGRAAVRRRRPRGRARARRGGSSSATRWSSRATPAAAASRRCDGLLASGDVGHFDEEGRLFVDGRVDEMIVSGGENVFPREVEDLVARAGRRRGRRGRSASTTSASASA